MTNAVSFKLPSMYVYDISSVDFVPCIILGVSWHTHNAFAVYR